MPASEFAALASKLGKVADTVGPAGTKKLVIAALRGGKRDYLAEIVHDAGADRKMSNWWAPTDAKGRKGPTLGVAAPMLSESTGAIRPRPVGPFSVLDVGRSKYGARTIKRGRGKGLPVTPTRGHGTADRAVAKIARNTGPRIQKKYAQMMMEAMRG